MSKLARRATRAAGEKPRRSRWRVAAAIVGAVLLAWGLMPLINGIVNIGVVLPVVVGLVGLLWGLNRPPAEVSKRKGWRRVMGTVVLVVVCLTAALGIALSACMIGAAVTRPAADNATVIVLGAKIVGDRPSRMLRNRLDAACAYLQAHPEAMCIVSGGQGSDERYSEAYVMEQYLLSKEIPAERLLREERSKDTHENIRFSMDIIRQQELCDTVVIATQEFHQYRAATLARWEGAAGVGAATCCSPPHLLLCYWVRECAAICRLWLFHY